MNKLYTCRYCNKQFNADPEKKNQEWVARSQNYYYHKKCWEEFINNTKDKNSEQWQDLTYYIITHLLKSSYNFHQIERQFKNFQHEGMTAKGIYFAVYWYFVIKQNPWTSKYGIGIVPHIYEDSKNYWYEQEDKKQGIMQQIEYNTLEAQAEGRKIKKQKSKRKQKKIENPF